MKMKILGLAVATTLLAACGGESDDPTTQNWQVGEVYYSYPYQGQQAVSPKTPMIIRFSHAVTVDPALNMPVAEAVTLEAEPAIVPDEMSEAPPTK